MSLVEPPSTSDPSVFDAERSMQHLMDMALLQQQEEDFAGAAQLYEKVLQQLPDHAEAHYQLGIIKTHTQGVKLGLPHFERAVALVPAVEQYWFGLIDALIMAHDTVVARVAIQEGIKHSLSAEHAAMLLAELDAMLAQHNADLMAPGHTPQPTKFVIAAPVYNPKSAGTVVLHELCDALNKRGYQAALRFVTVNGLALSNQPECYGPNLKWYALSGEEELQQFIDEGIVIYPEIISGNPLRAPRVVRYMLNNEGALSGRKINPSESDYIMAFSECYHPNPHVVLNKPCHYDGFNTLNTVPTLQRGMDLTYIGKNEDAGCYILPNSVELTREWPKNKAELAVLLKNTRYFYTWDYCTQTVVDAMLCGAIPIYMSVAPYRSFDDLHPMEAAAQLRTTATVHEGQVSVHIPEDYDARLQRFMAGYMASVKVFDNCLDDVLLQIKKHFGL